MCILLFRLCWEQKKNGTPIRLAPSWYMLCMERWGLLDLHNIQVSAIKSYPYHYFSYDSYALLFGFSLFFTFWTRVNYKVSYFELTKFPPRSGPWSTWLCLNWQVRKEFSEGKKKDITLYISFMCLDTVSWADVQSVLTPSADTAKRSILSYGCFDWFICLYLMFIFILQ